MIKESLFDDSQLLADLDEGGDGFVEVLALVGGGELDTDAGLAFRDNRIVEPGHEYSFLGHLGGELLGQRCVVEHHGVELIKQSEGSDPAAVVFDAVHAAKKRGADILIIDTAGRLHNKKNLMTELEKINRVVDKELPDCLRETILVLDATTGQNAVVQAREFKDAANITGLALTKLDGSAKGGIVFSVKRELGIPMKFIGVGEKADDLQPFNADEFIEALFAEEA